MLVDAATYVVAFVLVLVFVRAGKPVAQDESSRGVLAGVRFLARDRVLGPMTLTLIVLDAAAGALFTTLPALAYIRFGQDPKIVGWLFTAFGIGALAGSVLAMKAVDRFAPLRLAAGAMVLVVLPLWALVATLPWEAVGAVLLACGLFVPLVNAPIFGILSTRPPEALRPKVMTAVMTASALGGPAGRIVVGPMFVHWGIAATYAVLACAISLGALLFVLATLRADIPRGSVAVHDLAV
jgi:predicted MFS family arabinose efflux permease